MTTYDFAVIGGGMAGASIAAELAPHASVVLLEAEDMPGYHSTGRSAAFWHETLGGPLVQPLSKASFAPLQAGGFLTARSTLNVADAEHLGMLATLQERFAGSGTALQRLDYEGVCRHVPRARPVLVGAMLEVDGGDIDVGGLLNYYLGAFRKGSGSMETDFRVDRMTYAASGWTIGAGDRTVTAAAVVDAGGAWADRIAMLAGAAPIGLQPKRRTIAQVRVDGDDVPADLPLTIDIAGTYYFRPQGPNKLWLCPHDETPVDPCDAAPDELDVAMAIDRFEIVTSWRVMAVEHKWAGLRTFSPDRLPVYGFDASVPAFFWCAGQGGVGIQTAPAAARICAAMLLDLTPDPSIAQIDAKAYSPGRFAAGTK